MAPDAHLLITLTLALPASGMVAGLLAGWLGVGDGIVLVPVLFYIFTALHIDAGVKMVMAVGASLMSMAPTSIRSALAHRLDRVWLRRAFALFLGATGIKMAMSLL